MLFRFSFCCRKFHSQSIFTNYMNNFYVRALKESEKFEAGFYCRNLLLKIDREFQFQRTLSESVDCFANRIRFNIERELNKKKRKKKSKDDEFETLIDVSFLRDGVEVSPTISCSDFFFSQPTGSKLAFKLFDNQYDIFVNSPWINSLSVCSLAMANFPLYPQKIQMVFGSIDESSFEWYREEGKDWELVGNEFVYIPPRADIGKKLKLCMTPRDQEKSGPPKEALISKGVCPGPGVCPFEVRHQYTSQALQNNGLRVVSYNILADMYAETEVAKTELFPYCPPEVISLDYRKLLFVKELLGFNADVICLQEVDEKVFRNDLTLILGKAGFEGNFVKKGGTIREGVATFFRKEKFRLVESFRVVLGEDMNINPIYDQIWQKIKKNPILAVEVADRMTALQLLVLERRDEPSDKLFVANTHLYFHPEADHIRLIQSGLSVAFIHHQMKLFKSQNPTNSTALVFCGDFNSTPDCGMFLLMTKNHVPADFKDWKAKKGEHVEGLELSQPWPMQSAYDAPPFTNFTEKFADCLDYIYYQSNRLSLTQVVPLPPESVLRQNVAIPSVMFPSDHLSLVADFSWLPPT